MNPYDVPFPLPSPGQRARFSRKHGLEEDWTRLASNGIVHSVFRAGDAVVKIPRDHPEWVGDTLTEAVALPPVWAAGVPTAPLIAFDDDGDVFDVPVLVIGFVEGRTLNPINESSPTCGLLGGALALLHSGVKVVDDPHGWLDETGHEGAEGTFRRAADHGLLSPSETRFLESLLDTALAAESGPARPVFTHNDVHEGNVLFGEDGSLRLIDWGDAAWGDPAHDFACVPPEWLLRVVEAYDAEAGMSSGLKRRVALSQAENALRNIADATVWADEARSRLRRFSVVCGELLDLDIAPITA